MFEFIFKLFAFAIALLITIYAAANAFKNGRKLNARIMEYKQEQEAMKKSGKTPDPYAELANLYSDAKADRKSKTGKARRR